MDKAEKLKAARKKLKEFQSQHKKDDTHPDTQNEFPIETPTFDDNKNPENQNKSPQSQNVYSSFIPQQNLISSYFDTSTNNTNSFMSAFHPEYQPNESNSAVNNSFSEQQVVSQGNGEHQAILDQLNLQINQLKSEVEFHRTTATNLQKNAEELNKLRQQEKLHADTLKILITEKSNLMDALSKSELQVQDLKNETEELHNRLNVSRIRVKQLETQHVPQASSDSIDPEKLEKLVADRVKDLKESSTKLELERNELKILLNQHKIEMENLQKNFDHINTEFHLATIKIAQLSDDTTVHHQNPQSSQQLQLLSQEVAIKQQQINELNSIIDQLNNDRDSNETQYQNYVSAMSSEMKELKEKSIELTNENESLVKREQELLKHVSDLERQMQQQIQKQKFYAEQNASPVTEIPNTDVEKLTSQIELLNGEIVTLKGLVGQYEADKNDLMKSISDKNEEIQGLEFQVDKMRTMTPNITQLMSDFEDKTTAASRAVSQNQNLKEQLEELQRAFVNLSNDKMELTDKLQSEMHLCKEMKIQYDHMDDELKNMKEKWQFKENEMIRLSHENTELEKKILKQNIEIDRLRHYESKEYHGSEGIVENELENCKRIIETLTNKINMLESNGSKSDEHSHSHDDHSGHGHSHSHEDHSGHGHSHSHDAKCKDDGHAAHHSPKHCDESKKHLLEEIEMLKMEKGELIKAINDFQMYKKTTVEAQKVEPEQPVLENGEPEEMTDEKLQKLSASVAPPSVTPSIATEEALEKLQSRFRRTMLEVAELTEEKLRLEHLVTQLQFETETIGEYITLYQNQRRQLKQKEHEKDIQLKNLAADREMMNEKLCQLNGLIEKFVLQHSGSAEVAKEATKLFENHCEPEIISPDGNEKDFEKIKKETAGKILEILTDIKATNTRTYNSNCIGVENSCSCCYGKLETV